MFNRKEWISLLATDVYAALFVKYRFSRDAMNSEKSGVLNLSKEIADVIAERLEALPLEEMTKLWQQRNAKALIHAFKQFERSSLRLHVEADRLTRCGIKQPWKGTRRIHSRTKSAFADSSKFASRQFTHRHNNAWATLRAALLEYRLTVEDIELPKDITADEMKDIVLGDQDSVEKILASRLSIRMTKQERDSYFRRLEE